MELDEQGSVRGWEVAEEAYLSQSGEGAADNVLDNLLDDVIEDGSDVKSENLGAVQEQQDHGDIAGLAVHDDQHLHSGMESQRPVPTPTGIPTWMCKESNQQGICTESDTSKPARKGSPVGVLASVPATGPNAIRASWGALGSDRTASMQQLHGLQQRPATAGSRVHPWLSLCFALCISSPLFSPGISRTYVTVLLLCSRLVNTRQRRPF